MITGKPYPLPETWKEASIGKVVVKAKQLDPRKKPGEVFNYVDVSAVSNTSFKITGVAPTVGVEAPSRARKAIEADDVLFATVRPTLKRIALVPPELDGAIASTGYCVLRCDKAKAEPGFLYSFLITDHFNARMKPGDIFIERANTTDYVGLAALYEGDEDFAIFPDLLIRVRVDTARILPKVLIEWLLADPCRRYFKKNARSTAGNFPKIDQGTVEKTLIPMPSADEQAELETSFRTPDDKLLQHAARKAALQDLFRTLRHEVMTAKTRVHEIEFPTAGRAE